MKRSSACEKRQENAVRPLDLESADIAGLALRASDAALGIDITFALSPQAKGKIERPYHWMQDRTVRTCALERIDNLEDARQVLLEEFDLYRHLPDAPHHE